MSRQVKRRSSIVEWNAHNAPLWHFIVLKIKFLTRSVDKNVQIHNLHKSKRFIFGKAINLNNENAKAILDLIWNNFALIEKIISISQYINLTLMTD